MFEKKVSDKEKKELEKEEKKALKAQKKAEKKASGKGKMVKAILIPLFLAVFVTGLIYIMVQTKAVTEEVKVSAVFAKVAIEPNTKVTAENVNQLFEEKSVSLDAVSDSAYRQVKDIPQDGYYIKDGMAAGNMVYMSSFTADDVMEKYDDRTVETAVKVEDFSAAVNGSIRKGDIVDIYAENPASAELELMVSDVYVKAVFDTTGKEVTTDDGSAVSLTIYVTPDEVDAVNRAIAYKGIQIYRKK